MQRSGHDKVHAPDFFAGFKISDSAPRGWRTVADVGRSATLFGRWWRLSLVCVLIAGCQPLGPRAELGLGWFRSLDQLEELEAVCLSQGFVAMPQDYPSAQGAEEPIKPWRHKSDGVIYSYFAYPSRESKDLYAILFLSEKLGRLRVLIWGRDACPNRLFHQVDQDRLDHLARAIGEQFRKKVKFGLLESQRC